MATRTAFAPTTDQMVNDTLSKKAQSLWPRPLDPEEESNFDIDVVQEIYNSELVKGSFNQQRVLLLEFSRYLENYLWPGVDSSNCTKEVVISVACLVNIKHHQAVPAWNIFKERPTYFKDLFRRAMELVLDESLPIKQQTILLKFLGHCYRSLEVETIRSEVTKTLSLAFWKNLLPGRLEQILSSQSKLRKHFKSLLKKEKKADAETLAKNDFYNTFLPKLINKFCAMIASDKFSKDLLDYCQRFLDWLIDLDSCLPCRRWFNAFLLDSNLVVRCKKSNLYGKDDVFTQLVNTLEMYCSFEIDDITGEPLNKQAMLALHYYRMGQLQKCIFKNFPQLRKLALASVAKIDSREALTKHLGELSKDELIRLSNLLNLHVLPTDSQEIVLEMIVSYHERNSSQLDVINAMPLYPTETLLWDDNLTKTAHFIKDECLALPKLNLQFLTLHDYLLRNFNLFHLESAYEIRQDIENAVYRMNPWPTEDGGCGFSGWARMALPVQSFSVVEVAKPKIGELRPSRVRADLAIAIDIRKNIRAEWEGLRKHDVCFLLTVRPTGAADKNDKGEKIPFQQRFNVLVRGCEIEGMLDEDGRVIEEGPEPKPEISGHMRTYRVYLDTNQYQKDMESVLKEGQPDPYESFNMVVRRKPKENNFKAVLNTITDLMNTECVVPEWLHNVLLGYGNPDSAHYKTLARTINDLDWNDTFLSYEHLRFSFVNHKMIVAGGQDPDTIQPPFKLHFSNDDTEIEVIPHQIPSRGPYVYNAPKRNSIQFTPTQIEAIRSGMQPGLTMVVGPPGTGKTDVAVQIISNLYHNFPEQRTLIVTHSNQALNQLFEKIMELDIDERHLLRLGHGEEELETEKDFSRYGRVDYILGKRKQLLVEVGQLQSSLGVPGEVSYTCETAGHFFLYQVLSRWEKYERQVCASRSIEELAAHFPFTDFFAAAAQPLFKGKNFDDDWKVAEGCFRYIRHIFTQLEEFRAFELIRSGLDRSSYLLTKSAKIIAMTCTHAALKRQDLVEADFKYDNILMEESAQILEIETFIPLLLQNPRDGYNRLKRWIMIGDHHQLPPVVQNLAFQKFSNMEQSLFTRFVRLGVPTVQLDAQGRSRKTICDLFRWRYRTLNELPHVAARVEYRTPNPGFKFDYQLIDVSNHKESEPNPYFYQNLGEAEYCVALFMYMRLMGYPNEKITILTTYNGQKHLIRDVIRARCGENPLVGWPNKVTTVDRFQGQQNDYIILSLVRSKTVGHLRDVRRLVVALSRARLGLYIFARASLFANCFELSQSFKLLNRRPNSLTLHPDELYPSGGLHTLPKRTPDQKCKVINSMEEMAAFVYNNYITMVQKQNQEREQQEKLMEQINKEKEAASPTLNVSEFQKPTPDDQQQVPVDINFEIAPPAEAVQSLDPQPAQVNQDANDSEKMESENSKVEENQGAEKEDQEKMVEDAPEEMQTDEKVEEIETKEDENMQTEEKDTEETKEVVEKKESNNQKEEIMQTEKKEEATGSAENQNEGAENNTNEEEKPENVEKVEEEDKSADEKDENEKMEKTTTQPAENEEEMECE